MKFSLRQLQVFQLVAEFKSVSAAAKELHMSQSAASMALSQLETLLENPLFERQGRRLELNNWGNWLRPHVNELLNSCKTIELGMKEMDLVSGQMDIGASQTPAEHMLPSLISEMDRSFPRLDIKLNVENTEHVIAGLMDYRYDLGIIEGHCDLASISRQVWFQDELVIFASTQHPYAKQDFTRISQLDMAQWILREHGAGTREIFDHHIHEHIEQVKVHREYEQVNVIMQMVADNAYLGCLSKHSVMPMIEAGKLKILNVPELNMKREISFIWRNQEMESSARSAIIRAARKTID